MFSGRDLRLAFSFLINKYEGIFKSKVEKGVYKIF